MDFATLFWQITAYTVACTALSEDSVEPVLSYLSQLLQVRTFLAAIPIYVFQVHPRSVGY